MGGMREVSREQLYRELWSEPATAVAKRYGISDVGLTKVCRRYDIPKPGLGYWAKHEVGRAPTPPPLPPVQNSALETVFFESGNQPGPTQMVPEYEREKDPEWRIKVPPDLKVFHPLVKATAVALRGAAKLSRQPGPYRGYDPALLVRPGEGYLDIAVSKPLVPRALRIMQALVTALEKRGYSVSARKSETIVTVLGEEFEIALNERLKQVKVQRTYGMRTELEPSGDLRLRIGSSYSSSGVADRPPRLIEDLLNRFVAMLVRKAVEAKHRRAMEEERERRWEVHDHERRLRDQVRDSDTLRRRRLRVSAVQWARHRRLAAFVAEVDRRVLEGNLVGEPREAAVRWVEWAKSNLGKTDPIEALLKDPWPTAPLPPPASMPWDWK
jgi:hypothetical protein